MSLQPTKNCKFGEIYISGLTKSDKTIYAFLSHASTSPTGHLTMAHEERNAQLNHS